MQKFNYQKSNKATGKIYIGLDHGYGNIKTAHRVFQTGIECYDEEPIVSTNYVKYRDITGFAGTVLAMPPSVYLLGLDHAKVVLNVMAWLSGLMIAVTGYRHINWKELLKMSAVMLVGMFAGIQICRIVKSEK